MLGAGTVINPIIKIITTVAILAAVYFFILKPALETTNNAFESVTSSFDGFNDLPSSIQDSVDNAFSSDIDTDRLQNCIERAAGGNANEAADRVQRCLDRFGP